MARSLLIALLSVVAVAGPASAQLPALPADPLATVDVAADSLRCQLMPCVAEARAGCQYVAYELNYREWPPEVGVQLDPDRCVRDVINDLLPTVWLAWPESTADEPSATTSELGPAPDDSVPAGPDESTDA